MMLRYESYEHPVMTAIRGILGIVGLLALVVCQLLAQQPVNEQVLAERSVENRGRIVALESDRADVLVRLAKIETELDMARRAAESASSRMQGLMVGVGLILVERALIFGGYLLKRAKEREQ